MCGRYALGIRAAFVRYSLQEQGLPVDDAPADDEVRETYNFPPGAFGLVYRAVTPDTGLLDVPQQNEDNTVQVREQNVENPQTALVDSIDLTATRPLQYELKAMKWGLIPSWTKRSPDYSSTLRTINCRDDSLTEDRGLWNTMKQRKRCIVVAQGFYEWLKKGPGAKEKVPHFVKRNDGNLMCFAGLWDCVKFEDAKDKLYTYSIITTNSNKQLNFLHDRMPVILDLQTDAMKLWLDPTQTKWTPDLMSILKPYEGTLECYPVTSEVGKVGNNSSDFIVPVDSKNNKKNIANFFDNAAKKANPVTKNETTESRVTKDHDGTENHAPLPVPNYATVLKRKYDTGDDSMSTKFRNTKSSKEQAALPPKSVSSKKNRSPVSNEGSIFKTKSTTRTREGSQKITDYLVK